MGLQRLFISKYQVYTYTLIQDRIFLKKNNIFFCFYFLIKHRFYYEIDVSFSEYTK